MEAVEFLGILGNAADLGVLRNALAEPSVASVAVRAMAALGRVEAVPLLIDLMSDDALGTAATAAYRKITGATDVEAEKPFPPPEIEEGQDEEEALPPDPEKAARDWAQRAATMTPDSRWQWGIPVPDVGLPEAFGSFTLESRREAYLRARSQLGARVPTVELEALAHRQVMG